MRQCVFFLLLLLSSALFGAKPPELTKESTHRKAEEIFRSHVRCKAFTEEIARRTLTSFLIQLDPLKSYLLKNEIDMYENPSDLLVGKVCADFQNCRFETFEKIYSLMLSAIKRRSEIEAEIEKMAYPSGVHAKEFKDMTFVESRSSLKERLLRMRALQMEAAEKMGDEGKEMLLKRIQKYRLNREGEFLEENSEALMLTYFLKALTSSLDTHTVYFTPYEANQFLIQVQQRLIGIGAQLRDNLNGLVLMQLLEGGPALRGGALKVGDRIIAVDGEPIIGLDISEAVEKIRGPQGTPVTLTIVRESEESEKTFEVRIIRDEIVLTESRFESDTVPFGDGVIAILRLFSFYQDEKHSSAEDLRAALNDIKRTHKINGVILDLRGNAGGLISQAVSVTGLFIKKGIVVSVKDNESKVHHLRNFNEDIAWDGPMLVLTDVLSASAAEIVAQTLQEYGRALLVGDKHTFGKGSYQTFTLDTTKGTVNPQGEFKVTRGLYYTVAGNSPQQTGAKADIVIPSLYSEMEIGEVHGKFPLENDAIEANFKDTLADVHPFHRGKMLRLYSPNLQQPLNNLNPLKANLLANSTQRIAKNENYQNFLRELKKEEMDPEKIELYGQTDLQLEEAKNVLKDLILFTKNPEKYTPQLAEAQ